MAAAQRGDGGDCERSFIAIAITGLPEDDQEKMEIGAERQVHCQSDVRILMAWHGWLGKLSVSQRTRRICRYVAGLESVASDTRDSQSEETGKRNRNSIEYDVEL